MSLFVTLERLPAEPRGRSDLSWPRMRRGELTQMDLAWLDKDDDPAMSEWGVESEDVGWLDEHSASAPMPR